MEIRYSILHHQLPCLGVIHRFPDVSSSTRFTPCISSTDNAIAASSQAEDFVEAREVFQSPQIKSTDWPEAVWTAWTLFENLHGTVEEVETALDKIEKAKGAVNARRAKVGCRSLLLVRTND